MSRIYASVMRTDGYLPGQGPLRGTCKQPAGGLERLRRLDGGRSQRPRQHARRDVFYFSGNRRRRADADAGVDITLRTCFTACQTR